MPLRKIDLAFHPHPLVVVNDERGEDIMDETPESPFTPTIERIFSASRRITILNVLLEEGFKEAVICATLEEDKNYLLKFQHAPENEIDTEIRDLHICLNKGAQENISGEITPRINGRH